MTSAAPPPSTERSPFDHPEAEQALRAVFDSLIPESDRGAVLIGAEMVNAELERLLDVGVSTHPSKRTLLKHLRPDSPLATRADAAFRAGFIDRTQFDAITALRSLRNDLAHSLYTFRLEDQRAQLSAVLNQGPTVPLGVNRMALEILTTSTIKRMMDAEVELDGVRTRPIKTPEHALQYLHEHPQLMAPLRDVQCRYELGLGVALLCAMLILRRDDLLTSLAGSSNCSTP